MQFTKMYSNDYNEQHCQRMIEEHPHLVQQIAKMFPDADLMAMGCRVLQKTTGRFPKLNGDISIRSLKQYAIEIGKLDILEDAFTMYVLWKETKIMGIHNESRLEIYKKIWDQIGN